MLTALDETSNRDDAGDTDMSGDTSESPSESISLKTMLIAPTVGDLLTRTQLIPSRIDNRFGLLRYCSFPNRDACTASRRCRNVHYRKLIQGHTGE